HNPLFIYVGLIVLFLVFPMILMFLWFAYALHPDCRASILSKTVELKPNGLACIFDDGRTETIAWQQIEQINIISDDIIFHLSKYVFFILPSNAFQSPDDLDYFLKKIPPSHSTN
ncbi:MAG TPA: YcxB family protein, partial [Candidatus Barnesiella excrementigallinarum]|nr:YcxB family protein [Candidatus Barnesiella excrementigallinarum]